MAQRFTQAPPHSGVEAGWRSVRHARLGDLDQLLRPRPLAAYSEGLVDEEAGVGEARGADPGYDPPHLGAQRPRRRGVELSGPGEGLAEQSSLHVLQRHQRLGTFTCRWPYQQHPRHGYVRPRQRHDRRFESGVHTAQADHDLPVAQRDQTGLVGEATGQRPTRHHRAAQHGRDLQNLLGRHAPSLPHVSVSQPRRDAVPIHHRRFQAVIATGSCNNSVGIAAVGVRPPRVFLGRLLSSAATRAGAPMHTNSITGRLQRRTRRDQHPKLALLLDQLHLGPHAQHLASAGVLRRPSGSAIGLWGGDGASVAPTGRQRVGSVLTPEAECAILDR